MWSRLQQIVKSGAIKLRQANHLKPRLDDLSHKVQDHLNHAKDVAQGTIKGTAKTANNVKHGTVVGATMGFGFGLYGSGKSGFSTEEIAGTTVAGAAMGAGTVAFYPKSIPWVVVGTLIYSIGYRSRMHQGK